MIGGNFPAIGNDNINNQFTGSYDGNGKTINGLIINAPDYQGLFGYIAGATVKNIRLVNCNISSNNYTGSIVGYNDGGLVQNCSATGTITNFGGSKGGIVGKNDNGTVRNCYSGINIYGTANDIGGMVGGNEGSSAKVENCYATGPVVGFNNVGGIVGNNNGGIVQNCYATGSVTSSGNFIGGIVGDNNGKVQNCVALNTNITGGFDIGRVVGYGSGGSLSKNYGSIDVLPGPWTKNSDNLNDGEDIPSGNQYTENWWRDITKWNTTSPAFAWDFAKVWRWDSGITLPVLRN